MDHISLLVEISALRVDATAMANQGTFWGNTVLRSMLEHGNELLAEGECNHETRNTRKRVEDNPDYSTVSVKTFGKVENL
jgi:hypothetical protein